MDWIVYSSARKEDMGAFRHVEDAAAFCAMIGDGAQIIHASQRLSHRVLWFEGEEQFSAADSYDNAGAIVYDRFNGRMALGVQRR